MNDDLDALLRQDLLPPPPDFAQRVMKNLPTQAHASTLPGRTSARPASRPNAGQLLRWIAARAGLVGAGVLGVGLGLSQLASFVFGLWLTNAAL
jgi:hypothetical protein